MKVLILGHARHGKDQFAEYLGLSYQSSSVAALEIFLFEELNTIRRFNDDDEYEALGEAFEDRVNHRSLWHELIKGYNSIDRARLAKGIVASSDCYVGMRCRLEYEECIKQCVFDRVYWVDASDRKPLEARSSFNIEFDDDTMIAVDNNGSLDDLKLAAMVALRELAND